MWLHVVYRKEINERHRHRHNSAVPEHRRFELVVGASDSKDPGRHCERGIHEEDWPGRVLYVAPRRQERHRRELKRVGGVISSCPTSHEATLRHGPCAPELF